MSARTRLASAIFSRQINVFDTPENIASFANACAKAAEIFISVTCEHECGSERIQIGPNKWGLQCFTCGIIREIVNEDT